MGEPRDVTIVGAGIIGLASALALQRDGHRVKVIDRLPPGEGTSYGNAGMIQVDACVPIATPGVLRQVPSMLLDQEGPLVIRWRYLARLAPWLLRFVAASRPGRVEAISFALAALLDRAWQAYRPLIAAAGADDLFRPTGELYVYRRIEAYEDARAAHDLRRRRGVRLEELGPSELRQLEPALAKDIARGVFSPDCHVLADPLALSRRFAAEIRRNGGTFLRESVTGLEPGPNGPAAVLTDRGRHGVDRLVLAAGAFSKRLAASLGARLPLDTERGYHLMLPRPGVNLRVPLLVGDHRFGIIPMARGIRLAGTAELAGIAAPPNYRRARMLGPMARKIVPDLDIEDGARWMGYRPSMPDSLPVIGKAPGSGRCVLAFGHGHLGLTMGAVTGGLVADLIAGREPPIDMTPYRPERFTRARDS